MPTVDEVSRKNQVIILEDNTMLVDLEALS